MPNGCNGAMIYLMKDTFEIYVEQGVFHIRAPKDCCPCCRGRLMVQGSCIRKVRDMERVRIFRLRVMKCGSCGRTHRELPYFIVPYKRYGLNTICEIVCSEPGKQACPASTRWHLLKWLAWVIVYAQAYMQRGDIESRCSSNVDAINRFRRLIICVIREKIRKSIWYSTVIQT